MRITARTTVQKANHGHLRETVHAARRLNLNGISFLAADLTSSAFNRPLLWPVSKQEEIGLSLLEVGALEREIEALIEEAGKESECGFIAETPEKLLRLARQFRVQLRLKTGESPICNAPWVSAVIETDGTVRPCFFHAAIGNLQEGSLESIVNGEAGRAFRENLDIANNPICQRCVCSLHYRP
jgi:MoaA/NifB/PqqE/SkfB family radical SAM enzyme